MRTEGEVSGEKTRSRAGVRPLPHPHPTCGGCCQGGPATWVSPSTPDPAPHPLSPRGQLNQRKARRGAGAGWAWPLTGRGAGCRQAEGCAESAPTLEAALLLSSCSGKPRAAGASPEGTPRRGYRQLRKPHATAVRHSHLPLIVKEHEAPMAPRFHINPGLCG